MPHIQDTNIDLRPKVECSYIISFQYRRVGNPHKSLWLITHDEELGIQYNSSKHSRSRLRRPSIYDDQ